MYINVLMYCAWLMELLLLIGIGATSGPHSSLCTVRCRTGLVQRGRDVIHHMIKCMCVCVLGDTIATKKRGM